VGGSEQQAKCDSKRPRVAKKAAPVKKGRAKGKGAAGGSGNKAAPEAAADMQRREAAIADLSSFVAQNPGALDDFEDPCATQQALVSAAGGKMSKAQAFFSSEASEDIIERIAAAMKLEDVPKVMMVSKTWCAKLKPRVMDYAPSRRTLHNLMKRQVIVDASFLHDVMQDGGNSAGLTLRMHMILIDWLVDVAVEFHLGDATLALTSQIIGRFLSVQTVEKRELQLLGVTAMWIASKMEEVSVPLVSDFAWITYDTYTTDELRRMERRVLDALRFELSKVTPWTLVHTLLELPCISRHADMKHVTGFLHDLAIHDPAFSTESPGEVAAAVVYASLRALIPAEESKKLEDSGVLEYLLKCQRPSTRSLLEAMMLLPTKARGMEHKLSAVLVKYRREEHGQVADRILPDEEKPSEEKTEEAV